jgi:lipopolysaccharide transport system ATP-binding protein
MGKGRVAALLGIGFGFQPDLTGYENIFLHAAMYGIPRSDVLRRFDKIVEFAEVGDFIDTPLRHYSSGMYLRLAFSVAVNMQPDILLADEVLAVGDLAFQERCLQRVQEAGKDGMTVLFVSHDMAAITRLCHQVIWLNAGQIVRCGAPEEVVTQYQNSAWTLTGTRFKQGKKGISKKKYGEVLSVRLVSAEGKEIGAVRISEDVFVKATFSIPEPGVSVRCVFRVFAKGIYVFRSAQPQEFVIPAAAIYSASACIPAHLLAETIYTVTANVIITKDGEAHPLIVDNALTFQVYNTDESLSARGAPRGQPRGVIMPRLEWKVVKERDVVRT